MKLKKWLTDNDRSHRWFARQFSNPTATPTSVNRWCWKNATTPSKPYMQQIIKITVGQVTAADFKTPQRKVTK